MESIVSWQPQLGMLMGTKWAFAQDHIISVLFRTTTKTEMLAGSTGDTEQAKS
jgi:hypothetical protein